MLSADQQSQILAMYFGQAKSTRKIARDLKINRKSVMRIIERRSVLLEKSQSSPRASILDPFKEYIAELLKRDPKIPSTTILQRLRVQGYLGGKSNLNSYVFTIRERPYRSREAFHTITFAPGECAQVDWGEFGDVFGDGIKIHCFLMVLCYSRLIYIEFTRGEKFEDFIRCHQNAFRFFGGLVPTECWYDNLTSAVTERLNSLVKFNARFMAYIGHHGVMPHACNPARGNEKGRVEDGVKYIRSSFWPGRTFKNFEDLCSQASDWRDNTANRREHRSTHKIPILHFEKEEKAALKATNPAPYDTDELFTRVVPPNFMIVYETNRYSVPWTLVGMPVTVRVNDSAICFFYNEQFVGRHERSFKKHQHFFKPEHAKGLLERKPGASNAGWQLTQVRQIGESAAKYLDFIKAGSRSLKNEAARIMALATIYGESAVNEACRDLLEHGIIGTPNLELRLKTSIANHEKNPDPLVFQKEQLNRRVPTVDLRRYDYLLFESSNERQDDSKTEGEKSESGTSTGESPHHV